MIYKLRVPIFKKMFFKSNSSASKLRKKYWWRLQNFFRSFASFWNFREKCLLPPTLCDLNSEIVTKIQQRYFQSTRNKFFNPFIFDRVVSYYFLDTRDTHTCRTIFLWHFTPWKRIFFWYSLIRRYSTSRKSKLILSQTYWFAHSVRTWSHRIFIVVNQFWLTGVILDIYPFIESRDPFLDQ